MIVYSPSLVSPAAGVLAMALSCEIGRKKTSRSSKDRAESNPNVSETGGDYVPRDLRLFGCLLMSRLKSSDDNSAAGFACQHA